MLLTPLVMLWGVLAAQPFTTGSATMPAPRYQIAYSTYFGGSGAEQTREVIPAADGSVLVGGQTYSNDLPVTPLCLQPRYAGDDPALGHPGLYGGDCFLFRLSADGTKLLACTYFGGSRQERNVYGMELDRRGDVVITTTTRSPDWPATPGSFQPKYGGGTADWGIAKISGDLTKLRWATFLGATDGTPRGGLALDGSDHAYAVGNVRGTSFDLIGQKDRQASDPQKGAVIVKLKPDASALVWARVLPGKGNTMFLGARADAKGYLYLGGHSEDPSFPITPGAAQTRLAGMVDCTLVKLSPDGKELVYSTFLGGSGQDFAEHRLWLEPDGSVILTGFTSSPDFPTTPGAVQRTLRGKANGFISKLAPDGRAFVFSTYLGGSGTDFWLQPTVGPDGNIYVAGQTSSPDLPVTPDAVQLKYQGGTSDGALAILSPDGRKLLYCTYLGGSGPDMIRSIALGKDGEIWLTGHTGSKDFPTTPGTLQRELRGEQDAFVVKLVRR